MLGKYSSLIVENIFTREAYNRVGRFQNFDLAWGSDKPAHQSLHTRM